MAKLNFKEFFVYTGVSKKHKQAGDVRELFADLLYTRVNGIRSHALALKIYQSEGETDFTEDEVQLIRNTAELQCLPGFIDGLNEQLEAENEQQESDSGQSCLNEVRSN